MENPKVDWKSTVDKKILEKTYNMYIKHMSKISFNDAYAELFKRNPLNKIEALNMFKNICREHRIDQ